MGICFYTNRALFQIYSGHLKKIYAANIANKVTPLILINGGAYAVCRLLGKERINNRMSLAIVLQSALTFPRRRNPGFARWPGHPRAHRAVFASLSHQKVYSRGRETAGSLEKNTHPKSPSIVQNKTEKTAEKEEEEGGGGGRGPERGPLLDSIWFVSKTSSGFRNASCPHEDPPVVDAGPRRWGGRARFFAPLLPCKRWL